MTPERLNRQNLPLKCATCAWWAPGYRDPGQSYHPAHRGNDWGDCRHDTPTTHEDKWARVHCDDWCRMHSESDK